MITNRKPSLEPWQCGPLVMNLYYSHTQTNNTNYYISIRQVLGFIKTTQATTREDNKLEEKCKVGGQLRVDFNYLLVHIEQSASLYVYYNKQ